MRNVPWLLSAQHLYPASNSEWLSFLSTIAILLKIGLPFKVRIPTKVGFKNPKWATTMYVANRIPRALGRSWLMIGLAVVTNRLEKPKDLAKAQRHRIHQEITAPAIADYALIGDCRTAALVSCDGSVDWLCLPNFSSTSVFARLLDPRGGSFSLRPTQPFKSTRRYIDSTAVLETTFETEGGSARIFDCLPIVDGIRQIRPMREVCELWRA